MQGKLRGRPQNKEYRPITKGEFALLRQFGAKRTHFIGCDEYGQVGIYCKSNRFGIDYELFPLKTTDAVKILNDYWNKTL